MATSFQFVALPSEHFAPLFNKTDAELAELGACRMRADAKPGFPCRVSLADAEVGDTVLLLPFAHHNAPSPYRASGPIFVRQGVVTAQPKVNEIPEMLRHRLLSIRGYDAAGMMTAADVLNGADLEPAIHRLFADERVCYLHIHNARPGCYNCQVVRAE